MQVFFFSRGRTCCERVRPCRPDLPAHHRRHRSAADRHAPSEKIMVYVHVGLAVDV